jgi:hypothetical protein
MARFLAFVSLYSFSLFLLIACSQAAAPIQDKAQLETASQTAGEKVQNASACGADTEERRDIALLPDARLGYKTGNFITYRTASPIDQVIQFYQDRMAQEGWTSAENPVIQTDRADLIYTKAKEVAMLMFQQEAEGGTKVVISLNNPEARPG